MIKEQRKVTSRISREQKGTRHITRKNWTSREFLRKTTTQNEWREGIGKNWMYPRSQRKIARQKEWRDNKKELNVSRISEKEHKTEGMKGRNKKDLNVLRISEKERKTEGMKRREMKALEDWLNSGPKIQQDEMHDSQGGIFLLMLVKCPRFTLSIERTISQEKLATFAARRVRWTLLLCKHSLMTSLICIQVTHHNQTSSERILDNTTDVIRHSFNWCHSMPRHGWNSSMIIQGQIHHYLGMLMSDRPAKSILADLLLGPPR